MRSQSLLRTTIILLLAVFAAPAALVAQQAAPAITRIAPTGIAMISGPTNLEDAPPPFLVQISPYWAQTTGGREITLTGIGFSGAALTLDDIPVVPTSVTDTVIVFVAPPHEAGTCVVRVTTPSGEATTYLSYQLPRPPEVMYARPTPFPANTAFSVQFVGWDLFNATVTMDGQSLPAGVTNDGGMIEIAMSPHAVGQVSIRIETVGGSLTRQHQFSDKPIAESITPGTIPFEGGVVVVVRGYNLNAVTAVGISGTSTQVPLTARSDRELSFVAPPASGWPGSGLTMVYSGGSTFLQQLSYNPPPPVITSISPSVGPTGGGQIVRIAGDYVGANPQVTIGGLPAPIALRIDTNHINVITPATATPGTTTLNLRNPSGETSVPYEYEAGDAVPPAPRATVSGASPSSGSGAGGTIVTVSGSGFLAGALVTFGGRVVSAVTVVDSSTLTFATPVMPAGSYAIQVMNADGVDAIGSVQFTAEPCSPPALVLNVPPAVCAGGIATASVDGGPGFRYTWTVSRGTILSGQGTNTITFQAATFGIMPVTVYAGTDCAMSRASAEVWTNANAAISVPKQPLGGGGQESVPVCANSTGHVASVAEQPGATYTWTISGGTITSGMGTNRVTWSAGSAPYVEIKAVVTTACGSEWGGASIKTKPYATITRDTLVCVNATGLASVPAQAGATYLWSASNATITGGQGTEAITYQPASVGLMQILVIVTDACGTASASTFAMAIGEPVVRIRTDTTFCATSTQNWAEIMSPVNGATYTWSVTNATITSANGGPRIYFTAGLAGSVDISVTASACGSEATASASVPIDAAPAAPIYAPLYCSGVKNVANTNVANLNGYTFAWSAANATIDGPSNVPTIVVIPGASGTVTLTLTTTKCGRSTKSTLTVPIDSPPDVSIAAPSVVDPGQTAVASIPPAMYVKYKWSISGGTFTTPDTAYQVGFVAGASGPVVLEVTATHCNVSASATKVIPVTLPVSITAPESVCGSSSGNAASVTAVQGAAYQWSAVNGAIVGSSSGTSVEFEAGASGSVGLTVAITISGATTTVSREVPIRSAPVPVISVPARVCAGGSVTLDAGPDFDSYVWSNGATDRTVTFSPAATTTVVVTVKKDGCAGTSATTVVVDALPSAAISVSGSGSSATLTALPAASYVWSPGGETTQSIVATAGLTYAVTVTNASGCSATSSPMTLSTANEGSNVNVSAGPVSATFASISSAGALTVTPIAPASVGTMPGGYALSDLDIAYEISSTASFVGPIVVAIRLTPAQLALLDEPAFYALRVLHGENGSAVDRTILPPDGPSHDFTTGTIYARTSTLSPFALARVSAPTVAAIDAPPAPQRVGGTLSLSVRFTDPTREMHTAVWDWGDGQTSVGTMSEANGIGTAAATHAYAAAGVYPVAVRITATGGASATQLHRYVVVYDADGGFATGGGWLESAAGAFRSVPSASGKANFGFSARYKALATAPSGDVLFQIGGSKATFKSRDLTWLVLAGARAELRGIGSIDGDGSYAFQLTAVDGTTGQNDLLRIRIWNVASQALVYDNGTGGDEALPPPIGGGSITIHNGN